MLRATKKLLARLFCLKMKKAKNQRRLVIIVALIGVYYLGKHSSSLNARDNELGEKRYPRLRGPFHNSPNYTVHKLINLGNLLSKFNNRDNSQLEVLQKGPNDEEKAADLADEISTTAASKSKEVTPHFPAEQTNQQVKNPLANQNHKGNKQQKDTYPLHNTSDTQTPAQANQKSDSAVIVSTGKPNGKSLVQADKPKPTIITPRTPSQTAATTKPTISSEGSTNGETATETATVHSKSVDAAKVDHRLQILLKDKKLFGFVDKNATYQLQRTDVLKTASYSQLLQYQISRRIKPPSKVDSPNNDDFLYKYGYSKTTSDKLPLLRNVPDNRHSR